MATTGIKKKVKLEPDLAGRRPPPHHHHQHSLCDYTACQNGISMAITLSPGLSAGCSAPRLIEPAAGSAVRIAAPVFTPPPFQSHFLSRTHMHKKHGSNTHNVSLGIPNTAAAAALTLPLRRLRGSAAS